MWSYVTPHFRNFLNTMTIPEAVVADAYTKAQRIEARLNKVYYPEVADPQAMVLVGSHGKGTGIHPTSDVDVMYVLPGAMYQRFSDYQGNGQSALLQEFRVSLLETFPRTTIKADGQVVIVDFESLKFEIVPAFLAGNNFVIPDTNDGGRWKPVNTFAEMERLNNIDARTQGHVRALIKYAKVWKRAKGVPLKSIILENAAMQFVAQWQHLSDSLSYSADGGAVWWHDWLVRDFFEFLLRYDRLTLAFGEVIPFGDGWKQKTTDAFEEAQKACYYEHNDQPFMAETHWKNIFGYQFPTLRNPTGQVTRQTLLGGLVDV